MQGVVMKEWNETRLWKRLEKNDNAEARSVRNSLEEILTNVQILLDRGGTSPLTFTLHDSQHAFRVAERMADIVPEDVFAQLSIYELALLLLSAYLHDIGMSPEQHILNPVYDYLLTDQQHIDNIEKGEFQAWLDEQDEEVHRPVGWRITSRLIARYCRDRHVEWSENWIDKHISHKNLGTYTEWVDDLKTLCRSHHQGYKELITERFDPELYGGLETIVHLRYLAIMLRVADILDFDPERTPEIVFHHREIESNSLIYWYKDHRLTRKLERGRLTITARPRDARMHRAMEIMINEIEAELNLARRIDDEEPFEISDFQEEPLYHAWIIQPTVRRRIRPKDNAYEYIDGAFRPDTHKLLQILSGKELYGNELIAIRELLQNAFDAVREQVAYERLTKEGSLDTAWKEHLGKCIKWSYNLTWKIAEHG
jgi:hypothetical protein